MRATFGLPADCKKDAVCEFLVEKVGKGAEIVLSGEFSKKFFFKDFYSYKKVVASHRNLCLLIPVFVNSLACKMQLIIMSNYFLICFKILATKNIEISAEINMNITLNSNTELQNVKLLLNFGADENKIEISCSFVIKDPALTLKGISSFLNCTYVCKKEKSLLIVFLNLLNSSKI